MYSKASILLLDDPLSALDHNTAESIVRKCFTYSSLENRTIVLVTHRTSLVHHLANKFVEVSDGHITVSLEDPFENVDASADLEKQPTLDSTDLKSVNGKDSKDSTPQQIIEEEHREQGGIKAKVWLAFVKAGKYWWILLLLMMGRPFYVSTRSESLANLFADVKVWLGFSASYSNGSLSLGVKHITKAACSPRFLYKPDDNSMPNGPHSTNQIFLQCLSLLIQLIIFRLRTKTFGLGL
jgi:hypothetical protein